MVEGKTNRVGGAADRDSNRKGKNCTNHLASCKAIRRWFPCIFQNITRSGIQCCDDGLTICSTQPISGAGIYTSVHGADECEALENLAHVSRAERFG